MNATSCQNLLISKLDPSQLIGSSVKWLDETGSTNDFARDRALEGAPEGLVVLADSQSKGKGRQGRTWVSPPGLGLYFSMFLNPGIPPESLNQITLVAGAGLATALKPLIPDTVSLKWPNDILVGEKKLAGILSETVHLKNKTGIIVGIGVNVNHTEKDFPPPLDQTASSLLISAGQQFDRVELVVKFLSELDRAYITFLESGLAPTLAAWEQNSQMLGQKIIVTKGTEVIHGTALRLAPSGRLVLLTGDGREMILDSGEVHLSPSE